MPENTSSEVLATSTMIVTGCLLTIAFTAVLIHVHREKQSKWLSKEVALFLTAQFFLIVWGCLAFQVFVNGNMPFGCWLFGASVALFYTAFNLSHFFLAEKFMAISEVVPATLEGEEVPPETDTKKTLYWIILILNALFPQALGITTALFYRKFLVAGKDPSEALTSINAWMIVCTKLMQVLSGVGLIWAIIKIRNYFKEKNATDLLDTKMFTFHGMAFGLYLVGTSTTTVFLIIANLDLDSSKKFDNFQYAFFAELLADLVSESLICYIFWQWGINDTPDNQDFPDDRIYPVYTTDMEEDTDLFAIVWNTLLNKRL